MKYYIFSINFCSGDEYQTFNRIAEIPDNEIPLHHYANFAKCTPDGAYNLVLTNYGNGYQLISINKLTKEEFGILENYIDRLWNATQNN